MIDFINFLNKNSKISSECLNELKAIIKRKTITKGGTIINTNSHSKELFFITKGIIKFCFNGDGKEFIMRFFEENILFGDIESYFKNRKSKYEIIAIEDTEYFTFPISEFEQLCLKHHSLETFFRNFMVIANLNMMERVSEILEEDAKKRYINFTNKNPKLLNRISLGDLANYLGITQVSLSRIRANM
ncbi:Crp/Fnr family transcriptional regulator [Aquimarina aquimarini]|uniref:Crp/Fnr family transcriptional regulator n=1 Tax=Aquimarina aquimarini TaxID=1191734 RepID=UPI000D55B91A|nr:Crp/Fnr family transcriptional regulator [Aquimarina aquimarini]